MDDDQGRYEELLRTLLEAKHQKWRPSKVHTLANISKIPFPFVAYLYIGTLYTLRLTSARFHFLSCENGGYPESNIQTLFVLYFSPVHTNIVVLGQG